MSDATNDGGAFIDAQIFEDLQTRIDEDAQAREQIKDILQRLERQGRTAHSVLSRAHSTPTGQCEYCNWRCWGLGCFPCFSIFLILLCLKFVS